MPKNTDAIVLLKNDHLIVKRLLKDLCEGDGDDSFDRDLFLDVKKELDVHSKIEEEIFYPNFKEVVISDDGQELFYESQEEHDLVEHVLDKMSGEDDDRIFGAQANLLRELVEMHVDAEEKEMFPLARKLMGKEMLLDLGWKMSERKSELSHKGFFAKLVTAE